MKALAWVASTFLIGLAVVTALQVFRATLPLLGALLP